jgi:hypothetical protein
MNVYFISNGQAYSDYRVYGCIAGELDHDAAEAVVKDAIASFKERDAIRDVAMENWKKEHTSTEPNWNEFYEKFVYYGMEDALKAKCKEHGFQFFECEGDLEIDAL